MSVVATVAWDRRLPLPCHIMSAPPGTTPPPATPDTSGAPNGGGRGSQGAGCHILLECFGAHADYDAASLEALLRRAADAGGAQTLFCHTHAFGTDQGVTGVALLAESHITVHTWPERGYAAFDVFMCGDCDAQRAAAVIADAAPGARVSRRTVARPALSEPWTVAR